MMSAAAIGIDLGTSKTCVGVLKKGTIEIVPDEFGHRTTPNLITLSEDRLFIGDEAKINGDLNCAAFKRRLGVNRKLKKDGELSPEEASAVMLAKLKRQAETHLGKAVKRCVIAVPAFFGGRQRRATKNAAAVAGFDTVRLLNDTTAAAIAYGFRRQTESEERTMVVFDFGGGSLDVAVVSVTRGTGFEVRALAGDCRLGGEDIDRRIVEYFANQFMSKYGKDVRQHPRSLRLLRTACEKAKRTLSDEMETTIEIDDLLDGIDLYAPLSRLKFEELCADLFRAALDAVKRSLRDADSDKSLVDELLLVGGSSRIPRVRYMLLDYFDNRELVVRVAPDEIVACGATVVAQRITSSSSDLYSDLVLLEVAAMGLAIETANGGLSMLAQRNTRIPCKISKVFTTQSDNQKLLTISLVEGTIRDRYDITGIAPGRRGFPKITIHFDIDGEGLVRLGLDDAENNRRSAGSESLAIVRKDDGIRTDDEIKEMSALVQRLLLKLGRPERKMDLLAVPRWSSPRA